MKRIILFVFILFVGALLLTCQKITPLTPTNPVLGTWTLYGWQVYKLPAWFVTYSHADIIITPTDTVYYSGIGNEAVRSLTIAADHTFSEWYLVNDTTSGSMQQIDQGSWMLTDTVLDLSIANAFAHKLNYRVSTDQLVTDKVDQTALFWLNGDLKDTVRVPYTIRLFYRRDS